MDNSTVEKPQIQLTNKLAQELMEQKTIIVDGYEINLWTGHSQQNMRIQERWNAIQSYSLLNSCSDGSCGDIVLTGVMQIPRCEIAEYAINLGFRVHSSVSRNTDYLIFGSENVSPSKVASAIELNNKGANIQFIDELTFLQIVADNFNIGGHFQQCIDEELDSQNSDILITKKKNKRKINNQNLSVVGEEMLESISTVLSGLSIVISGTFSQHSRDEYKVMIEMNGGKNVGSVSAKTSFILAGENMGPEKLKKAEKLGVKLLTETEFLAMIMD